MIKETPPPQKGAVQREEAAVCPNLIQGRGRLARGVGMLCPEGNVLLGEPGGACTDMPAAAGAAAQLQTQGALGRAPEGAGHLP